MYYKVIGDGTILDVLKNPHYVTYQERNKLIVRCARNGARGVLSTDGSTVWHVIGWKEIPKQNVPSVQLIEIDENEYAILKEAIGTQDTSYEHEEHREVEPSEVTLEYIQEKKIEKMKSACASKIVDGVDVVLGDGLKHHFDLTIEDQINLISVKEMIAAGATEVPYHERGCLCKMYSSEDITILLNAASYHKTYQVTYFNSLKNYIKNLQEIEAVSNVYYGMLIPENYCSDALIDIADSITLQ